VIQELKSCRELSNNDRPKEQFFEIIEAHNDSLFVVAILDNKEINCLIDTGALISVLHRRIYDEISSEVRPSVNRNCGN
jgi:hypothetical protein